MLARGLQEAAVLQPPGGRPCAVLLCAQGAPFLKAAFQRCSSAQVHCQLAPCCAQRTKLILLQELRDKRLAADAGAGHGEHKTEGVRGAGVPQPPQLQLGGRKRGRVVQQAQGRGHGGCAQQDVRARRLPKGEFRSAALRPRAQRCEVFGNSSTVRVACPPTSAANLHQYLCTELENCKT